MAKKPKPKPPPPALPEPGAAFLMPLADGRFGVCRVLRTRTPAERKEHGSPCVLATCAPWIGTAVPDLADPRLREILTLTHHSYSGGPELLWVSDPPPDSYRPIGVIAPTPADTHSECQSFGYWFFEHHVLMEWRWAHDRDAVLREDAAGAAEAERKSRASAERVRLDPPPVPTLADLRTKRRLLNWDGFAPTRAIPACRAVFRDTVNALIALGDAPAEPAVLAIFQDCIERLNALDVKHRQFIETTIREELCEEFVEIAEACGRSDGGDLADRWRDW